MKLPVILSLVLVTLTNTKSQEIEIPEDFKSIEKHIFERIITPEDGQVEREIKSLFAQYILLSAMDAANSSKNSFPPSSPNAVISPPPLATSGASGVLAPQPQQVIYVYVTQPTQAPRTEENSKVKTKKPKPSKPPKTKKPKPPKAPHPDLHVDSPQPQVPQQNREQLKPQVVLQPQQIIEPQAELPAAPPSSSVQEVVVTSAPVIQASTSVPILTHPTQAAAEVQPPVPATVATPSIVLPTLRPRPSTEHVLNQVDKILVNVAKGNVTGIVDQSLQINSSKPVQNLVTGILNTIFCTPINRLFGRCRGRGLLSFV